jgi:hypothetical protein
MELLWTRLLHVLADMTRRCAHLAELARQQRQALTAERVREIGESVIEQERELEVFQGLEGERAALVESLGERLGVPPEGMTGNRFLSLVPPAWSAEYRERLAGLRAGVDEVKREHAVNRKLLQSSQEFVRWLVTYLVTPEGATPLYDDGGLAVQRSYYHFVNQMF